MAVLPSFPLAELGQWHIGRELCSFQSFYSVLWDKSEGQVKDDFHYVKFDMNSFALVMHSCFCLFKEQTHFL